MVPKWSPNGAKVAPTSSKNEPETPQRHQEATEEAQRGPRGAPREGNEAKIVPKMFPNGTNMVPKWLQNRTQIVEKVMLKFYVNFDRVFFPRLLLFFGEFSDSKSMGKTIPK